MSAEGESGDQPTRRGRPRKWASEAERKRAYRVRKAEDLAEPERLRLELRDERAEVRSLRSEIARLERVVERVERRAAQDALVRGELEIEITRRENTIAFWQRRAEIAEQRLRDGERGDTGRHRGLGGLT